MPSTTVLVLSGVQLALVVADLVERRWFSIDVAPPRPRAGTIAFLLAVTVGFAALQIGGLLLAPKAREVFDFTRTWFGRSFDRPPAWDVLSGMPLFVAGVLVFYIAGFWDYLVHRLVAHSRWFWFVHENHHLPTQVFSAMPGMFVRPFAVVPAILTVVATSASVYFLLAVSGLPLWDLASLLPVAGVIAVVLTASHSSFLRRWPVVHHVLKAARVTTPQEHLLHHTWEMDVNYGNFTTLWDRVFRTYLAPENQPTKDRQFGLPYDQDFLGTLTFGRWKLSPAFRQRFELARYCHLDEPGSHAEAMSLPDEAAALQSEVSLPCEGPLDAKLSSSAIASSSDNRAADSRG